MPSRNVFLLGALGAVAHWIPRGRVRVASRTRRNSACRRFNLIDQQHRPATREIFEGRWSVLYLGFTHCPDVCPTTLALLESVGACLRSDGEHLQIVFLSADPERDTPQAMARYLRAFDPDFIGLTGSKSRDRQAVQEPGSGLRQEPRRQWRVHRGSLRGAGIDRSAGAGGRIFPAAVRSPIDSSPISADRFAHSAEAVSLMSDCAQARSSRSPTLRGLAVAIPGQQCLLQAEQRPAILGIALQILAIYGLRLPAALPAASSAAPSFCRTG